MGALAGTDGRGLASRLLRYLVSVLEGSGGAVLASYRGRVFWFADQVEGDIHRLALAKQAWDSSQEKLNEGQTVRCGKDGSLSPIVSPRGLVGAVYLDGVPPLKAKLGVIQGLIAAAIEAPPAIPVGPDDALKNMDVRQFDQKRTLMLLDTNEWNIARVARLLGVTRRTVYAKLDKWGVERKKVDKGNRLAPA